MKGQKMTYKGIEYISNSKDVSDPNPIFNPFGKQRFVQYLESTLKYQIRQEPRSVSFTKVVLVSNTPFEHITDKECWPLDDLVEDVKAFKRVVDMINQGDIPVGVL